MKYLQYDDLGYLSVVISDVAPDCQNQIEMPEDTVTDGMMLNLQSMTLIPIPLQPDEDA